MAFGAADLRDSAMWLRLGRWGAAENRRGQLTTVRATNQRALPGLRHQIRLWPEPRPAAGTAIQVQKVLRAVRLLLQLPVVGIKLL